MSAVYQPRSHRPRDGRSRLDSRAHFERTVAWVVLTCAASGVAAHGGQITIERFSLTPTTVKPGESFEVSSRVVAKGVKRVSYVVRTTKPIAKEQAPPDLAYYHASRRLAYVAEQGQVHLSDNGPHDLDPSDGAFRIRIGTAGWRRGRYELSLFAHNRPGGGAHVVDERRFAVVVEADRVSLIDLGRPSPIRFKRCDLTPSTVDAGQTCVLRIEATTTELEGVEIRPPYHVAKEHVPPGFTYNAATRTARLADEGRDLVADNGPSDSEPARGRLALRLATRGWRPGLYHLQITARGDGVGEPDARHVAIKVRSPQDRLDVSVSPSWRMCDGTHAERMTRLSDGTLLHHDLLSVDGGKTWTRRKTGTTGVGAVELRSGRVLGMSYRTKPIEGREGWYRGQRFESLDHGRTVRGPIDTDFHVPQAKPAHGHAFHPGPLYMRSIVERPDGSLLALMAGWFKGDDTPCPHSPKRPYSRTYVCESDDGGKTWRYVTTIGYDRIGSEGYNEGSMKALPDGRLMALMRTGSMRDPRCQDNPVMQSVSEDGGRTWSKPRRTGAAGAFPDLLVLSDGTLAGSYGRPGANIMFSTDLGRTWTDHTVVDTTPYSGYTTICEIAPGEILMAFGAKGYLDPRTGRRSNDIRLATIRYRPKSKAGRVDALRALRRAGTTVTDLGDGFFECERTFDALRRPERFALHLPDGYRPDRREPYPLIVFLHGAGRNHRTLLEIAKTRGVLRRSPCVVLLPNGRGSWWIDSPSDPESQYRAYLDELLGTIDRHLNVASDPRRRAIGGWSMGGFGSASYLVDRPEAFGTWAGVVALLDFPNPAYPPEHNHAVPPVLGERSRWAAINPINKAENLSGKRLLLISAIDAFDRKMNEAFAAKLESLKIAHALEVRPGGHTIDVVASAFGEVMAFFHRHVAG